MKHPERGTRRRRWPVIALVLGTIPFAGNAATEEKSVTLKLVSSAFAEDGAIPRRYTAKGRIFPRP
jgi:hypothetical protein